MKTKQSLPQPTPIAHEHSQRLLQSICNEIDSTGPMTFFRYMQLALYAPGLGYYSAGAHKFGASGDFVTAPELTPLYGQALARQCSQVLATVNQPQILELGAGSGALALSILQTLQQQDALPEKYLILEVSADCRNRQQQLFAQQAPELLPIVTWLDQLPTQPIEGMIIANEVLDAMPVHKFQLAETLQEYCVSHEQQQLRWHLAPCNNAQLDKAVHRLMPEQHTPYESEINLALPAWIASLSDCLAQGVILLVDYGFPRSEYYHPQRCMGTIMCHYQQRAHSDPLIFPGIQDITAHVDFTAIAEAADNHGLQIAGYTHQAAFLAGCGIHELLTVNDEQQRARQAQHLQVLMHPSEMGELFKVIALSKSCDLPLIGYSLLDQTERLG
jgi:SAM-dependent MidA family methyltransferase